MDSQRTEGLTLTKCQVCLALTEINLNAPRVPELIEGISAETLLADRGYDTNQIMAYAAGLRMNVVIPAKPNRKQQRKYDRYLFGFVI